MSIIGIIWLTFCLGCLIGFLDSDPEASSSFGLLGLLFAIPYSIVGLMTSNKQTNITHDLYDLHSLKEKGIITEDEFHAKKTQLLSIKTKF